MNLCLLALCLIATEESKMLRVIYDLQIFADGRSLSAHLALNQWDRDNFSISCRKTPSGTLFTYWATPKENTLVFPRSELVFVGAEDQAFPLIPGGPRLTRGGWLNLLLTGQAETLGEFVPWEDPPWKMVSSADHQVVIRWREKRRSEKEGRNDRVLEPRIKQGSQVRPFSEFAEYWADHELD